MDEWDLWGRTPEVTCLHREPYGAPVSVLGSTDGAEDVPQAKAHRTRRGAWQPDGEQHPRPEQDISPKRGAFWHKASRVFQ